MKKIIAALMLLALAGVFSFYLKDYIDSRNPLYAIPQLRVSADTTDVPCELAGYNWRFANGLTSSMEVKEHYAVEPTAVTLLGGEQLNIQLMTGNALEISVRRSETPYSLTLVPTPTNATVPFENGSYLYEVYAHYAQGMVVYYFCIVVE